MAKEDFDKLSEELQTIVDELEKGEVGLSAALEKFQKGMKLVEKLEGQLKDTQAKVELLTKELEGKLKREEFEPPEEEEK